MPNQKRLRIAWFSALDGDSVSAYTSRILLPILRKDHNIDLFHDSFSNYQDYPTYHFLTAIGRHKEQPYDLFFYQLEDSKTSNYVRIHLALVPGVALFHNFLLSDDGPEPILNSAWKDVLSKFDNQTLSWPDRKKEHKKDSKAALRETGMSIVPVFTSERDLSDYRRLSSVKLKTGMEDLSFFLPYPVRESVFNNSDTSTQRVLYCGSPRIENRPHKLLQALSELKGPRLCWLVSEREFSEARRLLEEFGLKDADLIAGRTPEKWEETVKEGGIAIHTHFSVFGQVGPYFHISLMAGLPCLVSDFGSSDYFPSNVLFKIPPGEGEANLLRTTIETILSNPGLSRVKLAAEYAREMYSERAVAGELSYIFERSLPLIKEVSESWRAFEEVAAKDLVEEVLGKGGLIIEDSEEHRGGPSGIGFWSPASAKALVVNRVFRELGWGN